MSSSYNQTPRIIRTKPKHQTPKVAVVRQTPVIARVATTSTSSISEDRQNGVIPVSKLRPGKPVFGSLNDSILEVTQSMSRSRADAAIILDEDENLAGIITDTDVTRRAVAQNLDMNEGVQCVMTAQPKCVRMLDSALDALNTMVEHHFRHLPVLDDAGSVVGVLDIAKCLNNAISKLEKSVKQNNTSSGLLKNEEALQQIISASLQKSSPNNHQATMQILLSTMLAQNNTSNSNNRSLRSLLAGKPATIVSPQVSIRETGMKMAEARKAALVVENGELVGIFGFKDMMSRAVAKELALDNEPVSSVMTPNPESVSPNTTVLEALQIMHDNKFLTLPVCDEENNGKVVGLVDVMDVIYGCGGAEGWRSIFGSAMDIGDDVSESRSVRSSGTSSSTIKQRQRQRIPVVNATSTTTTTASKQKSVMIDSKSIRPVSKLRPNKPIICTVNDTVEHVCERMASKRGAAAIIVSSSGSLAGIVTDHDVVRRVASMHLDPSLTTVSNIMTKNPTCSSLSDPAMDALSTMINGHYRYLPIVDDGGAVVGTLDIGKCLNDAITKLEKKQTKSSSDNKTDKALKQLAKLNGGTNAKAMEMALAPLLAKAFSNNDNSSSSSMPTLRILLAGKKSSVVDPNMSIQSCSEIMADAHKAALVVEDDELVGIVSFKDIMSRAIAKHLPLTGTEVSTIMTPHPETVTPDTTVLEALQIMHDNKFLTLPVCEEGGSVVGVVDVMDVIYGCGGADGWRTIFDNAMDIADDISTGGSVHSKSVYSSRAKVVKTASVAGTPSVKSRPRVITNTATPKKVYVKGSATISSRGLTNNRSTKPNLSAADDVSSVGFSIDQQRLGFVFKVVDERSGNNYRIRCDSLKYQKLLDDVIQKLDYVDDVSSVSLSFVDEEGDKVKLSNDECLLEAVQMAKAEGNNALKLFVQVATDDGTIENNGVSDAKSKNIAIAVTAGVAALVLVGIVLLKRKK